MTKSCSLHPPSRIHSCLSGQLHARAAIMVYQMAQKQNRGRNSTKLDRKLDLNVLEIHIAVHEKFSQDNRSGKILHLTRQYQVLPDWNVLI